MNYILLCMVLIGFYGSAKLKTAHKIRKNNLLNYRNSNNSIKESFLSQSIVELVSIAGGIYVSLTLVTEFLMIDIPERVSIWGISFDFIAAVAIIFALLQPVLMMLIEAINNR
jgi:hypothetical protein